MLPDSKSVAKRTWFSPVLHAARNKTMSTI